MKPYLLALVTSVSLMTAASASIATVAAVDATTVSKNAAPAKTCVVTGNELGSMGPVVSKKHEGKTVKFCCKPCVAKFQKNPGKYLGEK